MVDVSLTRRSARELARLIRSGEVSPVEVLDAHLAVIERINPKLNAIVTLAAEQARDAARAAEAAVVNRQQLGALHGLPVAIKDITPTAGIRTTFASSARSTSASALAQGGATEIGDRRLKPTMLSSMKATSSASRPNAP